MWSCFRTSHLVVGLLMVLLCLGLAAAYGVRARHHFLAGRDWWAFAMVAGAVASGATATIWGVCTILGGPIFMGEITQLPPCDRAEPGRGIVLRLTSVPAFTTTHDDAMSPPRTPNAAVRVDADALVSLARGYGRS